MYKRISFNIFHSFLLIIIVFSCKNKGIKQNEIESFKKDTAEINLKTQQILYSENINADSLFITLNYLYEKSKIIKYKKGEAEIKYTEGVVRYDLSDYNKALENFDKAKIIASFLSDTLLIAKCIEQQAEINMSIRNENLAIKLFYEALPLFEKIKSKEGIAKIYNIIGYYKGTLKDFKTAREYFSKAMKLNREIGNQMGYYHNKGNMAFLYESMGNLDLAKKTYIELIDLLNKEKSEFNLSITYNNLSLLYFKNNKIDSAIYFIEKAILISESSMDKSLMAVLYKNFGCYLIEKQEYQKAIWNLNKSVLLAKDINDIENELNATKCLMQIDSIRKNFKDAFIKNVKIAFLNDTLNKIRNINNLKVSELQYENNRKSDIIEYQTIMIESSKKEKIFLLFLTVLSILTLSLGIAFVLLKIKSYKKDKTLLFEQIKLKSLELENATRIDEINKLKIEKIENEVKIKEKENITTSMALEQKINFLEQIKKQFILALKNNKTINIDDINNLLSSLKSQMIDSKDMDLFNEKFSDLHSDFFDKLKQKHPDLSKTELKFCAYLKLNLNSNQISNIMNVSGEAIRKSRYRIRKKINLSQNDSLEDYISQI